MLKKLFGTAQSRKLKRFRTIVKKVNQWDEKFQSLSEDELKAKTAEFKERLKNGETTEQILPEAYAVVKDTCRRLVGTKVHVSGYDQEWDMIPYDVQILGAISMHYGSIAEMMTGEGKTLTAGMPLYLNALTGKPTHLVTVNDYLAKRDCEWIGAIFSYHGLVSKPLTNEIPPHERKAVYEADIVYGTASEFGFDYLRDNSMVQSAADQVQRGYYFAIIDEVDSILVDEARTPLIISGPVGESVHMYDELKTPVGKMVKLQRDLSSKLATNARKTLNELGMLQEDPPKLNKEDTKKAVQCYKDLWLVGKGTPRNSILRKLREHPDIRARLEEWETYYHGDANKQERLDELAKLYIIVDERANDHELTDLGISQWGDPEDFVMLDLGHEYAEIDQNPDLDDQAKLTKKVELREADAHRKERAHNLRQLLRAHLLMEKDVDYIVQEGKIVIIDENTGRPQPGRRFSDGLHQAIEAKETVEIQQATQTYAQITLQNYFRLYDKLAGMTGTAMTEARELKEIYKLDVLDIPTHRKCVRKDFDDEVYMTEREKYQAIITEILEIHAKGRPILIGTESVDVSEKLARILKQNKLEHTVLNAKNHAHEAEIIAEAGKEGAITVATNMAGRGTDIKLKPGVADKGGLHVLGTTRHQSRRIDRQLRGRCARQGDPGSSKFYVSFEDQLMRLFTSPRLTALLQRFRPPEGEPITAKILNRSIETAQKRVEQRNYSMRKHTLEYDDVMNKQRKEVYAFRNDILHLDDIFQITVDILDGLIAEFTSKHFTSRDSLWDPQGFREELMGHFPVTIDENAFDDDLSTIEELETKAAHIVTKAYFTKLEHEATLIASVQKEAGKEVEPRKILGEIVRSLLLRSVDRRWQEHLLTIDNLRTEVGMRALGQKDPLLEFKHEAFEIFYKLNQSLYKEIAHGLFKFEMLPPDSMELKKHHFPPFFPEKAIENQPQLVETQ
ncbi:MAG: Protein translocase subunit SecA [Chlamydiia bacterium]|nr:Protein translocase subunit SecA [Chlamydiia bacterium]MCH9616266.1 Protein translocase subunit SecA [Chlamydiia bacterium]MCH9629748.1 Protein translocase subunit SecA [Chlamydiia bacterium]